MKSSLWYWLRLSRSGPFGNAGADQQQARLYRAALQQFEELMDAAAGTGPSARPLPLFYALSQAGRAIVAARGGPEHRGHGITIEDPQEQLLKTLLRPTKQGEPGQFQAVAAAVGSPELGGEAPLGALMASLPELSDELLLETEWPRALSVWPEEEGYSHIRDPEWIPARIVFDEEVKTAADVEDVLQRYPRIIERVSLVTVEAEQFQELPRAPTPGGLGIRALLRDHGEGIEAVVPQYRFFGRRWLRPGVVKEKEPPSPIMTWWGLLFGLSMLARYHPVPWVQALDPDSSPVAVPLERTMDEALNALPHLVFEELLGRPIPLPPG